MEKNAPGWQRQAGLVVSALHDLLGEALAGVYVHGSAALGGWTPASDLDLLVTTDAADRDWHAIGHGLLAALAPSPVIELSIISTTAASAPGHPWPFLVHVDQRDSRVIIDNGAGDADLLMHYLVARRGGVALTGPPLEAAFGPVPRDTVIAYLADELAWALEHADERYVVLNACRALAYRSDSLVLSKTVGGRWALDRGHDPGLVGPALDAQTNGRDLGPPGAAARAFVMDCRARLEAELSSP